MGGAAAPVTNAECDAAAPDTGPVPLRRLTGLEYQLTLQDLFVLANPPSIEGIPNNHLAYVFQWFFFAAAALAIYWLALRRRLSSGDRDPKSGPS